MGATSGEGMDFLAAGQGALAVREKPAGPVADDSSLVEAARGGDRSAFGKLYDRYAPAVHGILLARVRRDDVDDLVQDVFMIALRRLSTLRDNASFGGWLAAIARNRAVDFHRRSGPETQLDDELAVAKSSDSAAADDQRQARGILSVIKSLPEAYRETLTLRLVEGMTGPEIAARTGMTHGSVRVNLHRGMQQLRAKLGWNTESDPPPETY